MQLGQQVAQHHFGLALERKLQGLGGDKRVAVPVAAYPLAHAQESWHRVCGLWGAQQAFQLPVQAGYLAQEVAS